MSRKHDEPVVSRHIEVFEADWKFLQNHFGRASEERVGVSRAIRQMIRKGIRDYQERLARKLERVAPQVRQPLPALDAFFTEGASESAVISDIAWQQLARKAPSDDE